MTPLTVDHPDRQALILLCAPTSLGGGSVAAFGPTAWHEFSDILAERQLSPGQLLGMSQAALTSEVGLSGDQAERVFRLLARGGPLAIEIERLASRGIWIAALGDEMYPRRLAASLRHAAPPILFGVGDASVAFQPSLAIVGSRDADDESIAFTEAVAASAAAGGLSVTSGAARGVDAAAMTSALEHGGFAVGVLADGLEKRVREPQVRSWIADERLCLISPYGPNSGFSVGAAMGRNKLIYGLSEFALVVAAQAGTGGTWAGATEALGQHWSNVLVRNAAPNTIAADRLLALGAAAFPEAVPEVITAATLFTLTTPEDQPTSRDSAHATGEDTAPLQETLFGQAEPVRTSKRSHARRAKPDR